MKSDLLHIDIIDFTAVHKIQRPRESHKLITLQILNIRQYDAFCNYSEFTTKSDIIFGPRPRRIGA